MPAAVPTRRRSGRLYGQHMQRREGLRLKLEDCPLKILKEDPARRQLRKQRRNRVRRSRSFRKPDTRQYP